LQQGPRCRWATPRTATSRNEITYMWRVPMIF
jgi:hypothetical protein